MGAPYSNQTVSGYNSSPPPDDGSTTTNNKITWAGIKSKLSDPLNTFASAINTALRAALNVSPSTTSTNYTTQTTDHLTTVEVTSGATISLGDAASMIASSVGYTVTVYNKGTSASTVALITNTNTLAGQVNGTVSLPPGASQTYTVAQSGIGYDIVSSTGFAPFVLTGAAGTNTATANAPANLIALYAGLQVIFTPANTNTGATTLNITPSGGSALGAKNIFANNAACVGGELTAGVPVELYYDGTQFQILSRGVNSDNSICDFRLTLTSVTPVTTTDVTGATTVYCTPYRGNRIALFDGVSTWNVRTSAEFSIALGTLTSGLPYDVFCYDNSGVPTLEMLAWTSGTARATALVLQDGVLVKSGATTRRYLGTFYTTATTTTEDSKKNRYLFNYYNPIRRQGFSNFTTTRTTTSGTYGEIHTEIRVNWLVGWAEHAPDIAPQIRAYNSSAAVTNFCGLAIDSTTTPIREVNDTQQATIGSNGTDSLRCQDLQAVGVHYATILGKVSGGTMNFVGTSSPYQSYIEANFMM